MTLDTFQWHTQLLQICQSDAMDTVPHKDSRSQTTSSSIDSHYDMRWCTAKENSSIFWATVCKNGSPYAIGPLSVCPVLSVCDVCALWPNSWTDQDETWRAGRPLPWPHCVRWESSCPSPKGAQPPPNFRPISVAAKWLHGSRCHLVWS